MAILVKPVQHVNPMDAEAVKKWYVISCIPNKTI